MKIISRDAAFAAGALALLAASSAGAQNNPVTGITISLPANPDASSQKADAAPAPSCTAPAAGEGQETRAAISTSRSNIKRPGMTASAVPPPPGPASAAISTSRSNIKHPGVTASPVAPPPGPASAAINTSRSNIKRPGLAVIAPARGEACEAGAMQDVSTTR